MNLNLSDQERSEIIFIVYCQHIEQSNSNITLFFFQWVSDLLIKSVIKDGFSIYKTA